MIAQNSFICFTKLNHFLINSRDLSGSTWISKEELENSLVETIADIEYSNFVTAMERLSSSPYSYRIADFIKKYRKPLMRQSNLYEIVQPQLDENGKFFVTIYGEFIFFEIVSTRGNYLSFFNACIHFFFKSFTIQLHRKFKKFQNVYVNLQGVM